MLKLIKPVGQFQMYKHSISFLSLRNGREKKKQPTTQSPSCTSIFKKGNQKRIELWRNKLTPLTLKWGPGIWKSASISRCRSRTKNFKN